MRPSGRRGRQVDEVVRPPRLIQTRRYSSPFRLSTFTLSGVGLRHLAIVAMSAFDTTVATSRPRTLPPLTNSTNRSLSGDWPSAAGFGSSGRQTDLIGACGQRFSVRGHFVVGSGTSQGHARFCCGLCSAGNGL